MCLHMYHVTNFDKKAFKLQPISSQQAKDQTLRWEEGSYIKPRALNVGRLHCGCCVSKQYAELRLIEI